MTLLREKLKLSLDQNLKKRDETQRHAKKDAENQIKKIQLSIAKN